MPMTVASIRRYPVKSMGGEYLDEVEIDRRGLTGDRRYAIEDGAGHFASGKSTRRFRRRDSVFAYSAWTLHDGRVVVTDGSSRWQVGETALDTELSDAIGMPVQVTAEADVPHQDMGSVSIVTSSEPFVEETWVGRGVSVRASTLNVVERVPRCRMIDIDQDGASGDGRWLQQLTRERDMCLAVYADVAAPGVIRVGDTAYLAAQA